MQEIDVVVIVFMDKSRECPSCAYQPICWWDCYLPDFTAMKRVGSAEDY